MSSIQGWQGSAFQAGINHLCVAASEQLIHCSTSYIQTLRVLLLLLMKRMIVLVKATFQGSKEGEWRGGTSAGQGWEADFARNQKGYCWQNNICKVSCSEQSLHTQHQSEGKKKSETLPGEGSAQPEML